MYRPFSYSSFGLYGVLKDENRPTLVKIVCNYFANVSSVGLMIVSSNFIVLVNTLGGHFELAKVNIGRFGLFCLLLLGL